MPKILLELDENQIGLLSVAATRVSKELEPSMASVALLDVAAFLHDSTNWLGVKP